MIYLMIITNQEKGLHSSSNKMMSIKKITFLVLSSEVGSTTVNKNLSHMLRCLIKMLRSLQINKKRPKNQYQKK